MKHDRTIWATILVLAAASAGCRATSGASVTPEPRPVAGGPSDTAIEVRLEILDYRLSGAGAERALEFDLRNTSSSRLEFAYAIDWFDALGALLPLTPRGWTRLALDAGARTHVRVSPVPPEARSSRLRFDSTGSRP